MKKKRTDQKFGYGNKQSALGYVTKARSVPLKGSLSIGTFITYEKWPK